MKLNGDDIKKLFNMQVNGENKKKILDILNIFPENDRDFYVEHDETLTVKEFLNRIIDLYSI